MKKIVQFAISYPITIAMLILGILLMGKISYDRLGVDLLPSIDSSILYIELETVENPPVEVERKFVKNIEAAAIRTPNAKSVESKIRESGAFITVEYRWGTNLTDAFLDLQKAVAGFAKNDEITKISVTQRDPSEDPIMLLALSNKEMNAIGLTQIADNYIRSQLLSVEGVADVEFSGEREYEVIVETDPYRLEAFGLETSQIARSIEDNNYRMTGGRIEDKGVRYIVSGENLLESIEAFNEIIVKYAGDQKGTVFLKDVATVTLAEQEAEDIVNINGREGLGIKIYKEYGFNTLKATESVKKELKTIRTALPNYELELVTNQGDQIENSIGAVKNSALMGMLLAVLVLFVFLRRIGTTLIVSLAIPISIVATFNMFYFGGLTLNIMTLGGLALGAGMLVDNAIVVIESIFNKQESGLKLVDAIVEGTSEVGGAIIASTLTTIVVFLPIVYLQGETGALFKDQAWSVTFALVSSLLVAILAIPLLYSKLLGRKKYVEKDVKSIQIKGYGRFLEKILNYRYGVVLIAALFVGVIFWLSTQLGSEFMPKEDTDKLTVDLELPQGTTLEATYSTVQSIESVIRSMTADTTFVIYSHIGVAGTDGGTMPLSNQAQMIFDGNPEIISYLSTLPDIEARFNKSKSNGDDVIIEIKGEELDQLMDLNNAVVSQLSDLQSIKTLSYEERGGKSEINITINRTTASVYGLTMQSIISELRNILSGQEAGTMDLNGEMCDIKVKMPKVGSSELNSMPLSIANKKIILGEVADINVVEAPNLILRRGQARIMEIAVSSAEGVAVSELADEIRGCISLMEVPTEYSISIEGSEQKRQESMKGMIFALLLSIVLVYMVMASQFESLLHPFTVLLTIPFAVAGSLLMFLLAGKSLNIMAAIGIVMLVGIAVNSSILLVDRIRQLSAQGKTLTEAIVGAAQQRIRPIIMTSTTTILALLPMCFSFGEGSGFQSSMAIAVVGGLVTSTLMSLIVIPCVYNILESLKK